MLIQNPNLSNSEKKQVMIYYDEGVSRLSYEAAIYFFSKFTPYEVKTLTAFDVLKEPWEQNCVYFVIPGGRDIPYQKNLKGQGISKIRAYVEDGGTYIGICAGAYFASKDFIFEKGTPLEIIAQRDLAFFQGTAVGPSLGLGAFCYETEDGASYPSIFFLKSQKTANIYYNGGAGFPTAYHFQDVSVLATYPNDTPAIIRCQVKKGQAILSGVHFEMSLDENQGDFIHQILGF